MTSYRRFEELPVWKTARELTKQVYSLSNQDAFARDFGLRDQIRRASVSIMSNIAEGFESQTQALFINYLGRARASAGEVRSQLYVALDLKYISKEDFERNLELVQECSRQLFGLIRYLKSTPNSQRIKEGKTIYYVDF